MEGLQFLFPSLGCSSGFLNPTPMGVCAGFPTPKSISQALAVCLRTQFNSDITYPEMASDSAQVNGSVPKDRPILQMPFLSTAGSIKKARLGLKGLLSGV